MPAYAYPITIDRNRQTIRYDEIVTIEKNGLTLADLQFIGTDTFSIHERECDGSQFPGDGYTISISRSREETDAERDARVANEETYMAEYLRRKGQ